MTDVAAEKMERTRPSRRQGAGRAARLKKRQGDLLSEAVGPGLTGGQFKPLTDHDMAKIHQGALDILAKSLYRELTSQGYEQKHIVGLATALLGELTSKGAVQHS